MCEVVRNYFSKLLTEEEDVVEMINVDSPRMVTDEQNLKLIEDFTFEEFTTAITQMDPDKASGLTVLTRHSSKVFGRSWDKRYLNNVRSGLNQRVS